jgi:hypothetical protein
MFFYMLSIRGNINAIYIQYIISDMFFFFGSSEFSNHFSDSHRKEILRHIYDLHSHR